MAIREFLATTPEGTFLKIALGAALGALASWITTADVHPLVVAITAAVVPVVINYLNPDDTRYGRGHLPPTSQTATAHEPELTEQP